MTTKKILLAEDDQLISAAYIAGLTQAGLKVDHFISGKETLSALEKSIPDLMLLDLRMPEKDGFEVLMEMNEKGLIKKIPVIVTTNLDQESDIERCKTLGAKDYLIKSNTSLEDIKNTIKKYI